MSDAAQQKRSIKYFLRFGLGYRKRIAIYFFTMLIYGAFKTTPILLVRNYLQVLFSDNETDFQKILIIALLMAGCGIGMGLFSYFYRYLGHYLSIQIGIDIKNRVYNHFTGLPLSFFQGQEKGDLITKMTNDTSAVSRMITKMFTQFLPRPIEVIWLSAVCFFISWHLALLFLLVGPLIAFIVKHFGRLISKRSKKAIQILSNSTVTMEQFFSGIKLIKSFHSLEREEEKFVNVNRNYLKAHLSASRVKARSIAFVELFATLFMSALVVLGAYLVMEFPNELTPEDFLAFLFAFWAALNPARMLGNYWVSIMRDAPAAQRLFELLHTESDITVAIGAVNIDSIEPGIEFDNVRFSYDTDEVIKGIDLKIRPGEMVAFVGPSGGGKTTLLDLVPRFYEVDSGAIRIGGVDIREAKPDSLMSKIAIVLQDSFIFNSSAFENIRYGVPDASEEQIITAAKQANIHKDIEKLSEGYQTFLGEDGTKLSGGQKQRVSIARALLKGAPILIMDEPTSELDSESEKLIIDTLDNVRKDRILLVIAHRLSTVLHSDRIVVINDGTIEAVGTHDELVDTSPTYTRMYSIQFSDGEQ